MQKDDPSRSRCIINATFPKSQHALLLVFFCQSCNVLSAASLSASAKQGRGGAVSVVAQIFISCGRRVEQPPHVINYPK